MATCPHVISSWTCRNATANQRCGDRFVDQGFGMRVFNIHERQLQAAPEQIGALVDSLSSAEDALWPHRDWPRMTFDRALGIGAAGGHGPVRYVVEAYTPGHAIRFRFTGPRGFDGFHSFQVVGTPGGSGILRHTLSMTAHGAAQLSWPLVFRPLHDALLEDALARAQVSLAERPHVRPWSLWVRLLRRLLSGGKARAQAGR
jgi:hypothetical protein